MRVSVGLEKADQNFGPQPRSFWSIPNVDLGISTWFSPQSIQTPGYIMPLPLKKCGMPVLCQATGILISRECQKVFWCFLCFVYFCFALVPPAMGDTIWAVVALSHCMDAWSKYSGRRLKVFALQGMFASSCLKAVALWTRCVQSFRTHLKVHFLDGKITLGSEVPTRRSQRESTTQK